MKKISTLVRRLLYNQQHMYSYLLPDVYSETYSKVREGIVKCTRTSDSYNLRGIIAEIYCKEYADKFTFDDEEEAD